MAIDPIALKARVFPDIRQEYSVRDTMLYALGLGAGADPLDEGELRYVYEKDLVVVPTMAAVLCSPGFWLGAAGTGVDPTKILHAEQSIQIYRPLSSAGAFTARTVIDEIIDKGAGRGAILYQRRDLIDGETGERAASVCQSTFVRGEGGFGGATGPVKPVHPIPDRAPDIVMDRRSRPDLALLYRLNGDYNPLHADPAVARAAGFERPILHGLCTFGIACLAVVRGLCGDDPTRLRRFDARFSAPVIPGETLRTEMWRADDGHCAFRCTVVETGTVVLNNGLAVVA